MSSLSEVGDDIHVITTENWRLNSGLVVGSSRALVIDTGAGRVEWWSVEAEDSIAL